MHDETHGDRDDSEKSEQKGNHVVQKRRTGEDEPVWAWRIDKGHEGAWGQPRVNIWFLSLPSFISSTAPRRIPEV